MNASYETSTKRRELAGGRADDLVVCVEGSGKGQGGPRLVIAWCVVVFSLFRAFVIVLIILVW